MSDEGEKIAVIGNEQKNLERRISDLEGNQRYLIIAIVGAFLKTVFDLVKGGAQ